MINLKIEKDIPYKRTCGRKPTKKTNIIKSTTLSEYEKFASLMVINDSVLIPYNDKQKLLKAMRNIGMLPGCKTIYQYDEKRKVYKSIGERIWRIE